MALRNEIVFKDLDIKVMGLSPNKVLVKWETEKTNIPLSRYTFTLQRSESQTVGFKNIYVSEGISPFEYFDYEPILHNEYRRFYYRVRAKNNETKKTLYSKISTWHGEPDLKCLEIIRRLDDLLEWRTGTPVFFFSEITQGTRCPECWDMATGRLLRADCPRCKGTGKIGGFAPPVLIWADLSPDAKVVQHGGWGETQPSQCDILLGNFPIIKSRDIIIESRERNVWSIGEMIRVVKPERVIIQQMARVDKVNRSDIEYTLEVPEELRSQALEQLNNRKKWKEW